MNEHEQHGELIAGGIPTATAAVINLYFNWDTGTFTEITKYTRYPDVDTDDTVRHISINQIKPHRYKPKDNIVEDTIHTYKKQVK